MTRPSADRLDAQLYRLILRAIEAERLLCAGESPERVLSVLRGADDARLIGDAETRAPEPPPIGTLPTMADHKRALVTRALETCNGNVRQAARLIDVDISTVRRLR